MIEQHLEKGLEESFNRFKGLQASGSYLMATLITADNDFGDNAQSFSWKHVYKQGNMINAVDATDSEVFTLDKVSVQKNNPVYSLTSKKDLSSVFSNIQQHLAVFQIKDQPQPHISKFFQSEHAWLFDVMTEKPTHPENLSNLEPKKIIIALYSNFVPIWTSGRYLAELRRNPQLMSKFYSNMFSKKLPEDGCKLEIIYYYQPEHLHKSDVNFLVDSLLSQQIKFRKRVKKPDTGPNESDYDFLALKTETEITLNSSSKPLNHTGRVSVSNSGARANHESIMQKIELMELT